MIVMKAWERELEKIETARPVNFEEDPSDWGGADVLLAGWRVHLKLFWDSRVPGSRAPESLYTAMIQARYNQGYDVSEAEALLDDGLAACERGNDAELDMLSGRILKALNSAVPDKNHPTHKTVRPDTWEEARSLMPAANDEGAASAAPFSPSDVPDLEDRIHRAWLGQISGGSYGTALEGYTGKTLRETYGEKLNGYIKPPETLNDDITFELMVLKAAQRAADKSRDITADDIADMWLQYIPMGWSAEYFALENLRRGWYPPESGRMGNPFSEWIGAQMRTMVCGFLAPGDPMRAAKYAWMDSTVSHNTNGVYAGIHSAVLSSLAFLFDDSRKLLLESRRYVPDGTEFAELMDKTIAAARSFDKGADEDHIAAWDSLYEDLKTYNWIHAYPNMVAVVLSLWYCGNDLTRAFRILADCGVDVDCNAGEVGSALGIMFPVPATWSDPIGDDLETYVPGLEHMKISELSRWTADLAKKMVSYS